MAIVWRIPAHPFLPCAGATCGLTLRIGTQVQVHKQAASLDRCSFHNGALPFHGRATLSSGRHGARPLRAPSPPKTREPRFARELFAGLKSLPYLCTRLRKAHGAIAQLVEQRTENPCVPGSIPGGTTCKRASKCLEALLRFPANPPRLPTHAAGGTPRRGCVPARRAMERHRKTPTCCTHPRFPTTNQEPL